jgi:sec-independent protein translocase protein TatA
MPDLGVPELLIILVIVLVLFGPGRLAGAGTALGQAIREFRRNVQSEEKEPDFKQPDKQNMNQSKKV